MSQKNGTLQSCLALCRKLASEIGGVAHGEHDSAAIRVGNTRAIRLVHRNGEVFCAIPQRYFSAKMGRAQKKWSGTNAKRISFTKFSKPAFVTYWKMLQKEG